MRPVAAGVHCQFAKVETNTSIHTPTVFYSVLPTHCGADGGIIGLFAIGYGGAHNDGARRISGVFLGQAASGNRIL